MLCSIAISATLREICKKKLQIWQNGFWGTDLWNKRIELLQRVNCVGDIRNQNYIVAAICLAGLISPLPCTATRKLPRSSGAVVMTNYTASIMTTAAIHKIILREAEVCWWCGWLHNWENCWEFIPLSCIEMYIWSQELPRWCNRALWWSVLSVPSLLKICKNIGYCSAPYGFCIYVLKVNCGCTLQVAFKQVRSLLSMQEKNSFSSHHEERCKSNWNKHIPFTNSTLSWFMSSGKMNTPSSRQKSRRGQIHIQAASITIIIIKSLSGHI